MIIIAGLVIGAILGGFIAKSRKGHKFDIAQYAAVLGILGGVAGLFATLILDRLY